MLKDFSKNDGRIKFMFNVNVLKEGIDIKEADAIIIID